MIKIVKIFTGSLLAAALSISAVSSQAAVTPEVKDIVFGMGVDLPFAPHIIGIKKGWFKEAGFESVSTKNFSAQALAGQALIAEEIHLWTPANLPPIAMFHNGMPIVVLGTDSVNTGLEKIVVRKDSGINKPSDLEGKKVGLFLGSSSGALLAKFKEQYGIKTLTGVNLAPPEALAAMKAGDIDGTIVWEPWIYKALNSVDSKVIHTGKASYFDGDDGKPVKLSSARSVFVASQDFVRANPNTVQAIMNVLVRAQRFVAESKNRDEVIKLFSEFQKQDTKMNAELLDPANYNFDPTMGEGYVNDMAATADFLEEGGRIKNRQLALSYTYTDPLKNIDPSLVKVEGQWKP
ncbi:MAG: ABC transporter substrate-binding protein [Oceanospirillaceae bacterium]|nr:ABC transporter substrate-binding protein [Oceanospirillaceae bacterium]